MGHTPAGCADYAFQQHIHKSLNADNGRSVVLWPHGVLFRDAEQEMRKNMIAADVVDCVIGLGPNLFYNSPMESCLLICNTNKPKKRKGHILFINAVDHVRNDKTVSMLDETHIQHIYKAYADYKDEAGFAKIEKNENVLSKNASLNIAQYISNNKTSGKVEEKLEDIVPLWVQNSNTLRSSITTLIKELK